MFSFKINICDMWELSLACSWVAESEGHTTATWHNMDTADISTSVKILGIGNLQKLCGFREWYCTKPSYFLQLTCMRSWTFKSWFQKEKENIFLIMWYNPWKFVSCWTVYFSCKLKGFFFSKRNVRIKIRVSNSLQS